MPKSAAKSALIVGLLVGLSSSGCNLLFKLKATKIVLLTWLSAPKFDTEPFASSKELNAITATAFIADGIDNPKPVSGAFTAFFGRGQQFVMSEVNPDSAPGIYTVNSLENEKLPYDADPNRRFGMKACLENVADVGCVGEEFTLTKVRAAPAIERDQIVFDPPLQAPTIDTFNGAIDAGTALTVTFPEPTDEFQYHPLVTMLGPTADSPVGIVFNSLPVQGPDVIKFVTEAPPRSITIPADKLSKGGLYLVLVAAARIGLDSSDNVLVGAAISGAMTGFIIEVKGDLVLPDGTVIPEGLLGGIPNIPGLPTNIPTNIPGF